MINNAKILAFRRVATNRAQLQELLNHPVMKSAFDAVSEAGRPRTDSAFHPGIHPDTITSRNHYKMIGINEFVDTLFAMTFPPNAAPDEQAEEKPFEHNLPPELRLENLPKEIRDNLK